MCWGMIWRDRAQGVCLLCRVERLLAGGWRKAFFES